MSDTLNWTWSPDTGFQYTDEATPEEERPSVIPINSESCVDWEGLVSEIDSSKSIPPEGNHGDFA